MTYTYSWGYKTREDAQRAMFDMMADGSVSYGDQPEIIAYRSTADRIRYKVTLQH